MRLEKRFLKTFRAISVIVLTLSIAACSSASFAAIINDGKLTICHANGNTTNPYDEITLDFNGLTAHVDHKDDLIPVPAGGCPEVAVTGNNVGKLTICHTTDNGIKPYNEITIDFNGLRGHSNHIGDVIPAPEGGCPSVTVTPAISATPTITATPGQTGKITICHATGSANNPYVMITVSINGLNGHDGHTGDIIPAPAGGCPSQ